MERDTIQNFVGNVNSYREAQNRIRWKKNQRKPSKNKNSRYKIANKNGL